MDAAAIGAWSSAALGGVYSRCAVRDAFAVVPCGPPVAAGGSFGVRRFGGCALFPLIAPLRVLPAIVSHYYLARGKGLSCDNARRAAERASCWV
jgi:hypothetical protein